MATKRVKRPVRPAIATRAEFEALVGELAREIIGQRDAQNALDAAINELRKRYEPDLIEAGEEVAEKLKLAQEFCDAHAELFPKDRKSLDLVHATVGYRTGQPKLKTLRGWTWGKVLDAMRDVSALKKFIRTKEEPDKEGLIARREELVDVLPLAGMQCVQEESFFVEPKIEEQPNRLQAEAA